MPWEQIRSSPSRVAIAVRHRGRQGGRGHVSVVRQGPHVDVVERGVAGAFDEACA